MLGPPQTGDKAMGAKKRLLRFRFGKSLGFIRFVRAQSSPPELLDFVQRFSYLHEDSRELYSAGFRNNADHRGH